MYSTDIDIETLVEQYGTGMMPILLSTDSFSGLFHPMNGTWRWRKQTMIYRRCTAAASPKLLQDVRLLWSVHMMPKRKATGSTTHTGAVEQACSFVYHFIWWNDVFVKVFSFFRCAMWKNFGWECLYCHWNRMYEGITVLTLWHLRIVLQSMFSMLTSHPIASFIANWAN